MTNLLKNLANKKIISLTDFYFSQFISENNPIAMLVSACVSFENKNGHIFLPIEYFEKKCFFSILNKKIIEKILLSLNCKNINWLTELLKHKSFSDGSNTTPLVLFEKKIYLYKIWKSERKILKRLSEKKEFDKINTIKYCNILNDLFSEKKYIFQKIAVALTLIHDVTFIIGSAGTGKTTTIIKIAIALIKKSEKTIKIQLSAPTGRATERLIEILNNKLFNSYFCQTEMEKIFLKPITLHKLLGISKISEKIFFNKKNLLSIDVLIIDEASMIDILMAYNIFSAMPKKTKIIFIGDHKQLQPIKSSSILKYIYNYAKNGYSIINQKFLKKIIKDFTIKNKTNEKKTFYISDKICILKKNYRFDKKTGIYILSKSIYSNKEKILCKLFRNSIKDVFFYELNSKIEYKNMIEKIVDDTKKYWKSIYKKKNIKEIIKNFKKNKILCIVRNGCFGINFINKILEEEMHKKNIFTKFYHINDQLWYIGKPILITKNNEYLGIFNGEVGIANLSEENVLQVSFLRKNKIIKNIPVQILKNYETAWSTTVHKAQGSEFDNTTLILPNKDLKILKKDILYTGITRSRKKLIIYSTKKIFISTITKK